MVSGYTKPPSQDSNLAGISQVNLVANGLRLGRAIVEMGIEVPPFIAAPFRADALTIQTPLFQRGRCQVPCNRRDDPPAEIGSCCDARAFSCVDLCLHETHDRIIFRADRSTRTVTPSR
jgi:hypothetical protein